MHLHLIPSYFLQYSDVEVKLKKFEIPELKFDLTEKELATRKPFPNKSYNIACSKKYRKAIIGFTVNVEREIKNLTLLATWEVNSPFGIKQAIHKTNLKISDNNHSLVSQYHNRFSNGTIKQYSVMLFTFNDLEVFNYNSRNQADNEKSGVIVYREEDKTYPTVEVEYYKEVKSYMDRFPELNDFEVKNV